MLRARLAEQSVELRGCDDFRIAPYFHLFPTFAGSPQVVIDVEQCAVLPLPAVPTIGHGKRARWGTNENGETVLYSPNDENTARFVLRCSPDCASVKLSLCKTIPSDYRKTLAYLYASQAFSYFMLAHGGCALHSAGLVIDGKGVALAGESGVGKTTLARALCALYPTTQNVNDDSPVLCESETGFTLYGTPFCGDGTECVDRHAPLRAVVMLRKARENRLYRLSPANALMQTLACMPRPIYLPTLCETAIARAERLIAQVPVYCFENDGTSRAAATLLRRLREEAVLEFDHRKEDLV